MTPAGDGGVRTPGVASRIVLGITIAVGVATAQAPVRAEVGSHVCAEDEGKGACTAGRVRMCRLGGALAGCVCPPGTLAPGANGACAPTPGASAVVDCLAPDTTIAKAMAAELDLGELAVPSLPPIASASASDTIAALDMKVPSLGAPELSKLAAAHESVEAGAAAAAADAAHGAGKKVAGALARRDGAVARAIDVRRVLLARFGDDTRAPAERVALARALLRRAAYRGFGPAALDDRAEAHALLVRVVAPNAPSALPSPPPPGAPSIAASAPPASSPTARRDAAFMLGEEAARARSWAEVVAHEGAVLRWAGSKLDIDDAAILAAASARLAQAKMELGDLAGARPHLADAVSHGFTCAPRAECVSSAIAARNALPRVWAARSEAPRTMAPILSRGALPRHERVRPLLRLAEAYATGVGAGCAAAADEARAWAQVVR